MGYRENLYDVVLVLHIATVVVGFGTVFLNGVYGAATKEAKGVGALAIFRANYKVSSIAQNVIYTVPLGGILLVLLSDGAIGFDELWVWLSMALYVVGIGVSHGVMKPAVKRTMALLAELAGTDGPPPGAAGGPPPQAAELEANGKRMAMAGTFLNLLLVVILVLMVFKPGGDVL